MQSEHQCAAGDGDEILLPSAPLGPCAHHAQAEVAGDVHFASTASFRKTRIKRAVAMDADVPADGVMRPAVVAERTGAPQAPAAAPQGSAALGAAMRIAGLRKARVRGAVVFDGEAAASPPPAPPQRDGLASEPKSLGLGPARGSMRIRRCVALEELPDPRPASPAPLVPMPPEVGARLLSPDVAPQRPRRQRRVAQAILEPLVPPPATQATPALELQVPEMEAHPMTEGSTHATQSLSGVGHPNALGQGETPQAGSDAVPAPAVGPASVQLDTVRDWMADQEVPAHAAVPPPPLMQSFDAGPPSLSASSNWAPSHVSSRDSISIELGQVDLEDIYKQQFGGVRGAGPECQNLPVSISKRMPEAVVLRETAAIAAAAAVAAAAAGAASMPAAAPLPPGQQAPEVAAAGVAAAAAMVAVAAGREAATARATAAAAAAAAIAAVAAAASWKAAARRAAAAALVSAILAAPVAATEAETGASAATVATAAAAAAAAAAAQSIFAMGATAAAAAAAAAAVQACESKSMELQELLGTDPRPVPQEHLRTLADDYKTTHCQQNCTPLHPQTEPSSPALLTPTAEHATEAVVAPKADSPTEADLEVPVSPMRLLATVIGPVRSTSAHTCASADCLFGAKCPLAHPAPRAMQAAQCRGAAVDLHKERFGTEEQDAVAAQAWPRSPSPEEAPEEDEGEQDQHQDQGQQEDWGSYSDLNEMQQFIVQEYRQKVVRREYLRRRIERNARAREKAEMEVLMAKIEAEAQQRQERERRRQVVQRRCERLQHRRALQQHKEQLSRMPGPAVPTQQQVAREKGFISDSRLNSKLPVKPADITLTYQPQRAGFDAAPADVPESLPSSCPSSHPSSRADTRPSSRASTAQSVPEVEYSSDSDVSVPSTAESRSTRARSRSRGHSLSDSDSDSNSDSDTSDSLTSRSDTCSRYSASSRALSVASSRSRCTRPSLASAGPARRSTQMADELASGRGLEAWEGSHPVTPDAFTLSGHLDPSAPDAEPGQLRPDSIAIANKPPRGRASSSASHKLPRINTRGRKPVQEPHS